MPKTIIASSSNWFEILSTIKAISFLKTLKAVIQHHGMDYRGPWEAGYPRELGFNQISWELAQFYFNLYRMDSREVSVVDELHN